MALIAQITDLHLRDDGADPAHDPAQALRQAFAQIAAMDMRPDAIVLTGDVIDRTAGGYDQALALLREAPVPLIPMPGNHDPAPAFRAAFADWVDFAPDHLSFTQKIGTLNLIALDSTLPDGTAGVDDARLQWVESALAAASWPTLLAMHHPPFPTAVPHLDKTGFVGASELSNMIAKSAVCRVIAGHTHRAMQTIWAGCLASTAPAIGHGLTLSLTGRTPSRPAKTTPSFELHVITPKVMASHLVEVSLP
ncbi:MAG: metallophosphoesterase [Loktanella sp.]|nr:metallophosphoesterase [Loktanella sp.]